MDASTSTSDRRSGIPEVIEEKFSMVPLFPKVLEERCPYAYELMKIVDTAIVLELEAKEESSSLFGASSDSETPDPRRRQRRRTSSNSSTSPQRPLGANDGITKIILKILKQHLLARERALTVSGSQSGSGDESSNQDESGTVPSIPGDEFNSSISSWSDPDEEEEVETDDSYDDSIYSYDPAKMNGNLEAEVEDAKNEGAEPLCLDGEEGKEGQHEGKKEGQEINIPVLVEKEDDKGDEVESSEGSEGSFETVPSLGEKSD